jgi:hypothetical protein
VAAPRLVKPRAIAPGATIGIAAPGGPVDPALLAGGRAVWEAAGFRVVHRDDIAARRGYLAGDDDRRAAELAELVADPAIDAIVCARGGYGAPRILDRLDAAAFRAARKPLVGYSDATALLLWRGAPPSRFPRADARARQDVDPKRCARWRRSRVLAAAHWSGTARVGGAAPALSANRARGGEPRHAVGGRHARRDPPLRRRERAAVPDRPPAPAAARRGQARAARRDRRRRAHRLHRRALPAAVGRGRGGGDRGCARDPARHRPSVWTYKNNHAWPVGGARRSTAPVRWNCSKRG